MVKTTNQNNFVFWMLVNISIVTVCSWGLYVIKQNWVAPPSIFFLGTQIAVPFSPANGFRSWSFKGRSFFEEFIKKRIWPRYGHFRVNIIHFAEICYRSYECILYIHMYAYIYIYMYVCMYTCIYILYICMYDYKYIYIYTVHMYV